MPDDLSRESPAAAALAAAIVVLAAEAGALRLLDLAGALDRRTAAATTIVVATAAALGLAAWLRAARRPSLRRPELVTIGALALGAGVIAVALIAAAWLPVWQWDAAGYHLPFVNGILQPGARVPFGDAYVLGYPHLVDYLFLGWRALLPDDTWIDAAQIPLGLLGAVATATLARQAGARAPEAHVAGAIWLALPLVFLQLPTNYVDVATATWLLVATCFVLREPTRSSVAVAALALALALGSKPSTPLGCAILSILLWRRARAGGLVRAATVALALAWAIGGESYWRNLVVHRNPIWPVALHLGPLPLPGLHPIDAVLGAGAQAAHARGSLPARLAQAWLRLDGAPSYDMRLGGFGPLFPPALVVAGVWIVRRRAWSWLWACVAAVAVADPSVGRFTLALPALALAASAAALAGATARARRTVALAATIVAALGAWRAAPGLAGEGPPLAAYRALSPEARRAAVGPDGFPAPFLAARQRVAAGEAIAYDGAFELPYLLWRNDLKNRVVRIPDGASVSDVAALVARQHVRVLVACAGAARVAAADEARWQPLFETRSERCSVRWRR